MFYGRFNEVIWPRSRVFSKNSASACKLALFKLPMYNFYILLLYRIRWFLCIKRAMIDGNCIKFSTAHF